MSFDETAKRELEGILASMGADAFDSDAKQRLARLVSQSDEARRIYLEHCQMHAMLHQSSLLAAFDAEQARDDVRMPPIPPRWPFARWAGLAVAACAVLAIAMNALQYFRDEPGGSEPATSPRIAFVHSLQGRAWFGESELTEGAEISSGVVRVESGSVDLRFDNGTALLLEGPTELSIDTDMQVSLKQGQVVARVSEKAHGFTVLGPDSAVVDLGTEFAMVVEGGKSWVEVYDGEVDIALLNEDGHAWKSRQLTASGPVRIDAPNGQIVDESPRVALPRFSELPPDGLKVPAAYVDAVLKSGAAHYWRFEEATDGRVADIAGDAVAVLNGGTRLHNEGLHFPPGRRNHGFVFIAEPIQSLLSNEFALEAWVNPSFAQKRTLIDINHRALAPKLRENLYRLALLPAQQQTVYPKETFRFIGALWPYGEKGVVSTFSADRYLPGSWHHVVVVRRRNQLDIYLNGKPAQTVSAPPIASDLLPSTITIGRNYGPRAQGAGSSDPSHFKGLVDEVAVYPSALSAEEVAEHYRLMRVR